MGFVFKKQLFGFMDLLRFKKMVKNRREKFEEAPLTPLPKFYAVNETAKILHPGYMEAVLKEINGETEDTKTFIFETEKPFYFRAGQYVTVSCDIDGSFVSRPYAISSSPAEGLKKRLGVTVKKSGFFSDYLNEKAKTGDKFIVGEPTGEFCYEPIKDAKTVVGIAGGSGITPFYSMAKSIKEGSSDFNLIIFYGAKKQSDIIFERALRDMECDKIKVVFVLSDQKCEGYEHGFITADIIKKYAGGDFTVMACGPVAMYKFLDEELKAFSLPKKRIKKEANCVGERDVKKEKYKIIVNINGEKKEIEALSNETVLCAMERAGLRVPSKCRAGGCGFCHSKLISGKFTIAGDDKRRLADSKFGYIHPCCSYPDSDMELIVPPAEI